MGHIRIHFLLCITFLLVVFTCSEAETISSTESQKIQNLRAFAKLYGYVKYFHPSDEANAIDWDKFAIYGAKQVKDAKDTEELKTALEVLFLPIAPTIQIYTSDQKPEGPKKHVPDDTTGLKIVAWQHLGFGSRKRPYRRSYRSIRLNRKNRVPVGGGNYAHIVQSVGASEHRGKLIRLKAFARTNVNGFANQGELWLEIEREGGKPANFDVKTLLIKAKRPWQAYEIVRKVPDDAKTIHVICSLRGMGQIWADEFELLVMDEKDEWRTIEIENSGSSKHMLGNIANVSILGSIGIIVPFNDKQLSLCMRIKEYLGFVATAKKVKAVFENVLVINKENFFRIFSENELL